MTEQNYQDIFCSNMMKANQDIVANGLTEQTVDIFIENSEHQETFCPILIRFSTLSTLHSLHNLVDLFNLILHSHLI